MTAYVVMYVMLSNWITSQLACWLHAYTSLNFGWICLSVYVHKQHYSLWVLFWERKLHHDKMPCGAIFCSTVMLTWYHWPEWDSLEYVIKYWNCPFKMGFSCRGSWQHSIGTQPECSVFALSTECFLKETQKVQKDMTSYRKKITWPFF